MKQRTIDLIGITQDELDDIKNRMENGDTRIIYSDKKLEVKLMKIQNKVYEAICRYGEKPFRNIFSDMIKVRHR